MSEEQGFSDEDRQQVAQSLESIVRIVLRKELDFKWVTLSGVAATLLQFVSTIAVAYVYRSVWALVVGQIVLASVRTLSSFLITRERPRISFNWPMIRELFRYGKFVTGTAIVTFLTTGLDKAVAGKRVGDQVEVKVPAAQGFGDYDPSLTFTDVIENVPPQFREIGAEVQMKNDQGETKVFYVSRIEDGKVTVDGNHPLAGVNLNFGVKVVDVREASQEEIEHGHVHGPGGHQH